MQVVNTSVISNKKVLLRYDIDVALRTEGAQGKLIVGEEFKLKAGLETLKLCLENAVKVVMIGHVGRPFKTAEDEEKSPVDSSSTRDPRKDLSAQPIFEWVKQNGFPEIEFAKTLEEAKNSVAKFVLLENTRFFHGEVPGAEYHATCTSKTCDVDFAHQLASLGEVYVNEAFSSHNSAASTTIVPTLIPHFAGLHFAEEVQVLGGVRDNPKKPFIAIMGGAKVDTKLPVINVLAKKADAILVGGKLIAEIREQKPELPANVMVGKLNQDGFDISEDTTSAWGDLISKAAMIVWNGPMGKFEVPKYNQTEKIIDAILNCPGEIIIGGGDSVAALSQYNLLEKAGQKGFVSVGGGAMLKFLSDGTLPTIEALR